MIEKKQLNILGFDVELVNFGYSSYLYPCFNGNVEYKADKNGFKELYSYLRSINGLYNKYGLLG